GRAMLGGEVEAVTEPTNLRHGQLGAQLAVLALLEGDAAEIRMAADPQLAAVATFATGQAIARIAAKDALCQLFSEGALAETGRAADQQRMRQPAIGEQTTDTRDFGIDPGHRSHDVAPRSVGSATKSAMTWRTSATTASSGRLASITRNRAGSAAARSR